MRWTPCLAVLAIACGDTGEGDAATEGCPPFSAVLGEGNYGYEPRAEGESMRIVRGIQPGFHIELGGELLGTTGMGVKVEGTITELTQNAVLASASGDTAAPGTVALYDPNACSAVFFGARMFVDDVEISGGNVDDYQRFICTLAGHPIQVDVEVTDSGNDESVSLTWTGTITIDPSNDC